jgi:hypothetical protein
MNQSIIIIMEIGKLQYLYFINSVKLTKVSMEGHILHCVNKLHQKKVHGEFH